MSQPISNYAAARIDARKIPPGINVPFGPSWAGLIRWLLKMGVGVSAPAIPDVVSLYLHWSIVWAGKDPWTPRIVEWFYYWLSQIDTSLSTASSENRPQPFKGELTCQECCMR